MARYQMSLTTAWSPDDVFAYLGDLRNFARWDPGVRSATLVSGGEPGPGAAYDVEVRIPFGAMTLRYETVVWEPPYRLVVAATTPRLSSRDEITVSAGNGGANVLYDAVLTLRGALAVGDPLLALAFRRIGDRAGNGLRHALECEPTPSN
jgi:hypothetical protein